jgi:molybdenum cofactor cytidylyltransferase
MTKTAAIVLAAGASSRFGKPKQLAILRGETLVRHAVAAAISASCAHVAVVVGEHAAEIRLELAGLGCDVVVNHEWREGLAGSIRTGLQQLLTDDHDIDCILLLACDQPLVNAQSLQDLMRLRASSGKAIVASTYAGTLGIPALFARSVFHELLELTGDRGAKELILSRTDDVASFDLPDAAIDIDTVVDYERLTGSG